MEENIEICGPKFWISCPPPPRETLRRCWFFKIEKLSWGKILKYGPKKMFGTSKVLIRIKILVCTPPPLREWRFLFLKIKKKKTLKNLAQILDPLPRPGGGGATRVGPTSRLKKNSAMVLSGETSANTKARVFQEDPFAGLGGGNHFEKRPVRNKNHTNNFCGVVFFFVVWHQSDEALCSYVSRI